MAAPIGLTHLRCGLSAISRQLSARQKGSFSVYGSIDIVAPHPAGGQKSPQNSKETAKPKKSTVKDAKGKIEKHWPANHANGRE
jgi:hypothetical protein